MTWDGKFGFSISAWFHNRCSHVRYVIKSFLILIQCYCNGDNCNMDISSAPRAASQAWVALMTAGLVGMSSAPSTQHGILGISLLALISSQPSSSSAESTLVAPLEVAGDGTVTCYACGQPEANPNASFCDVTITPHHCNLETTKIYNLSCSLMDNMREPRLKRLWER